ncbi:MAG: sialidase family protein [Gemmatimonadota bacterium]
MRRLINPDRRGLDLTVPRASILAVLLAGLACGEQPTVTFSDTEDIGASTSVGAAPMFAVAPSGARTLAWISAPDGGTDGRLYVSTESAPTTELRDPLGGIEPHGESPPKLEYAPDGTLFALYAVGRENAGRRFPFTTLRLAASRDRGRTWDPPQTVGGDPISASRNFHALHAAADGSLYVAWLEARDGRKSATYLTRSTDGGTSWSQSVRVDAAESCPCCRTAIATAEDGTLYLEWRSVLTGNVRDIVVASSHDHGATWNVPVRSHVDNFVFDGCPHAGPSLAVDVQGRVHIAWWTGKDGGAGVYYARSDDGARSFGPAIPIGVAVFARPAHTQLKLDGTGTVVVAWDDARMPLPRVTVRVSRDGGETFGPDVVASDSSMAATFPVLALRRDGLTLAWTQQSPAAMEQSHRMTPDMKDPTATMPLPSVGAQTVMVRSGRLTF